MEFKISTKGAVALLAIWVVGRPLMNMLEHASHSAIKEVQAAVNDGRLSAPKNKQVGFIGSIARQQNR